jgi:hypothetical protein
MPGVLRSCRCDNAEKYHDDKPPARYSRDIHSAHKQTFNWEMARPGAAPRHAKQNTNHRNAGLRLLRVLHVFHIARVATAAALVLVRRSGVILHRVFLLQVTRVTAACAATVSVGRSSVIFHRVLLLQVTRVTAACAAILFVRSGDVILQRVFLRHIARITTARAAARLHFVDCLNGSLREGDAGDRHCQSQHAN